MKKKNIFPNCILFNFFFFFLNFQRAICRDQAKQNIERRTFPIQEPTGNQGTWDLSSPTSRNWMQPIIWMSLEADLSSESIDKNPVILTFWILALWDPNQRSLSKPIQTSELQSCELKNGYCFRPLNLRWFVTYRLPWWLSGKESTFSAGCIRDMSLIPGSGRYLLEEGMAIHFSILA